MAHLTLQLGAAIVVPFGVMRRNPTDTSRWKARSLREAAAVDAGLPVLGGRFSRYVHARLLPAVTARTGGPVDGSEACEAYEA
ncbi:MAG: hypothetical protein ABI369_16025 [Acetobacteraceae bacterium]